MTSKPISLIDRYDLLALHRGLMEARFCEIANDPDVSGSPILARIHRDTVAAIIESEKIIGLDVSRWWNWLLISEDRREWAVAVQRASMSSRWGSLDDPSKRELAHDLLAPFTVNEELLDIFLATVEKQRIHNA